ncbi:MAG: hypothetical protein A4E69_00349 [Syntrophus sp. PtaB.Bin138]|nr:MAG: hypothetical protein A4E69_00349 [Syntrophus sp. PtaB.Bin138]
MNPRGVLGSVVLAACVERQGQKWALPFCGFTSTATPEAFGLPHRFCFQIYREMNPYLRPLIPARPASPTPRRSMVAGSGTGVPELLYSTK